MFSTLNRWFTPPVFEDEIKTQHAYLLHVILWTLVCIPVPYVIYTLVKTPENTGRTLVQVVFGELVNILLLIMMRYGKVRLASIIQVCAFWLFFTGTAFTGIGIHGEAYMMGYALVIAIAGILLGGTGALTFTVLSLAMGGLMVYVEGQGWFIPKNQSLPLTTWIVSLVLFPVGATLQYLNTRTVRHALARARESEERYRLISDVSTDYTFMSEVDQKGNATTTWAAGAFERMTGYTFEEYMAGGGWIAHVHPDDLEKDARDMELLHKNQDVRSEIRTFTKDGDIRWERIFAHPVWDNQENRLIRIVGAVQDVTEQKQVEQDLSRERDLLQIFMDNIPDTVYFKDIESRFIRINRAQARFLGLDNPEDAIGRSDSDFMPAELALQFLSEEQQIIETGLPVINRIEHNPAEDGTSRWMSATKVRVKNSTGQVIGTIGVSRDITKQKEAEEAVNKIHLQQAAILDNIPDMAWLKDNESIYIAVNDRFCRIAGLKPSEIIGKTDLDIWREDFARAYLEDDLYVIQSRKTRHIEEQQMEHSGRIYWVETIKTPIFNALGEIMGTAGISRDISDRKQAELERESLISELENKNAELERFTYTVSHDLKSPLVTISGFLTYLEKDARKGNLNKLKGDIQRINQAVVKMQNLLKDLLELSRIGRLMNPPMEIMFDDIVRDALDLVRGQIEAGGVEIEFDHNKESVYGDRIRLTEVIQNLVDNAVKFSKSSSDPKIKIGVIQHPVRGRTFFVQDNGIGIEPQYHDQIFGLFNKLNPDSEGTGVGLALVRRIINVHGGRIWVESEVNHGATFYFTLPLSKSQEQICAEDLP